MDLSCKYMGLQINSPLVVGACDLATSVETVKKLEAAGAGMLVMHSLFEEQFAVERAELRWAMEHGWSPEPPQATGLPDADEFRMRPEEYYALVTKLKAAVKIPVVGSVNGTTPGNWVLYARRMEEAGADAIELNVYDPTMDPALGGTAVEARVLDIVKLVRQAVKVPLAVKLSPFYSSFANLALQLDNAGVDGIVLFNRFYQPDIDIDKLDVFRSLKFSTSDELLLRLRWTAALYGRLRSSLAVTGGVHTGGDVIKSILAGATVVQMASCLIDHGPEHMLGIWKEIQGWMASKNISALSTLRGKLSLQQSGKRATFERVNYVNILTGKEASAS